MSSDLDVTESFVSDWRQKSDNEDRREYIRRYQREWIAERRAEFFSNKTCIDCGATENLELDHQDPTKKITHRIWSWSLMKRVEEIAKCDVRCNDCHKKRHGARHGTKGCYETGCRCFWCVEIQRDRRQRRRIRRIIREMYS